MNGSSNRHSKSRQAYTLIEMIISMVLVSALMSSVWGIMSLYNSLLTAGRDQTTQQQLVRSVFQLIDEDVRAVAISSPTDLVALDNTIPGQSNLTSLQMDLDAFSEKRSAGLPPVQISLTGTSTAIRLSLQRFVVPAHEAPSDIDLLNELGGGSQSESSQQPEGQAADVPEFQTVVYQLQSPGSADGANSLSSGFYRLQAATSEFQSLIAQRSTIEQNMATDDVAVGRPILEALLFPAADSLAEEEASDTEIPEVSFERIPEVVGCRFQYFDGRTWRDDWPSDQRFNLPAAVRVSLDVVSTADASQLNPTSPSSSDVDRLAGQPRDTSISSDPELRSVDSEAAAATLRATRFERTILLDSVHRIDGLMTANQEGPL